MGIGSGLVACEERCSSDHERPVGEREEETERRECQEGGGVGGKDKQEAEQPKELRRVEGSSSVKLVLCGEVLEIE